MLCMCVKLLYPLWRRDRRSQSERTDGKHFILYFWCVLNRQDDQALAELFQCAIQYSRCRIRVAEGTPIIIIITPKGDYSAL